jgi:hypothetical protein
MPEWWKLRELEGTSTKQQNRPQQHAETMATAGTPEKARTTEKAKTPANHEFWWPFRRKIVKMAKKSFKCQVSSNQQCLF